MTKVVNSWNEWDPLKRVIIGRPEGTNIPAPEPAWSYDLLKYLEKEAKRNKLGLWRR